MTRRFEKRLRRLSDGVWTDGKELYYFGAAGILGTANQITVTDNGDGTITLSTPQDLDDEADVQFDTLTLGSEALAAEALGTRKIQVSATGGSLLETLDTFSTTNQFCSRIQFRKSATDTIGTKTTLGTVDWLGMIEFQGVADDGEYHLGAYIKGIKATSNHGNYICGTLELGCLNHYGDTKGTITIDGVLGYIGLGSGYTPCSTVEIADNTNIITFTNTSRDSDADGAHGSKLVWRGFKNGGGIYDSHTVGQITISHDGAEADEKGRLLIELNSGSNGFSPFRKFKLDSDGVIDYISGINMVSNDDEAVFHNDEAVFAHPTWVYGIYV